MTKKEAKAVLDALKESAIGPWSCLTPLHAPFRYPTKITQREFELRDEMIRDAEQRRTDDLGLGCRRYNPVRYE